MTRFHVLLHCSNARLAAAGVEAWEGRDPSGIRVLLSNPRWGRRLLEFLELFSVGRAMKDSVNVKEAQASRTDEWIVW